MQKHPKFDQIQVLRAEGKLYREIAKTVGLSISRVYCICNQKDYWYRRQVPNSEMVGKISITQLYFYFANTSLRRKEIAHIAGVDESTISRWRTKWRNSNAPSAGRSYRKAAEAATNI